MNLVDALIELRNVVRIRLSYQTHRPQKQYLEIVMACKYLVRVYFFLSVLAGGL